METPTEIELKLDLDPALMASVEALTVLSNAAVKGQSLKSTYFDTPENALRSAGFVLRVRRQGRRKLQTVKAEGRPATGLFVRSEWELPIRSSRPDYSPESGPLAALFEPALLERVEPIFTTRIDRLVRTIEWQGAKIEVAIDQGVINAGKNAVPVGEVELELVSGTPAALFSLAREIAAEMPLRLGVQSKSDRGYALILAPPIRARRAEIILDPASRAADGFATIAMACIRHYRLNEGAVIACGDSSSLHQARVALRQLRTAFWLFGDLLNGDAQADHLRKAVRSLAARYGEVRNLDVMIPRFEGGTRKALEAARGREASRLRRHLEKVEPRLLMIRLTEWIMTGEWRGETAAGASLASGFASDLLDRQRKRLKRKGKGLAQLSPEARHRARIEAKRLRYATEFFASLYPGKRAGRRLEAFRLALADLQDMLGELNDREMAPIVLEKLHIDPDTPMLKADKTTRLLVKAENAYDALFDAKPFWRG